MVSVIRLPAAATRGVLEIEVVTPGVPSRWRVWVAIRLMRIAGRLARMRVRVLQDELSVRQVTRDALAGQRVRVLDVVSQLLE